MMLLKLRTSRCFLRDKDERVPTTGKRVPDYGGKGYRTTGEKKFKVKLYLSDIINNFSIYSLLSRGGIHSIQNILMFGGR